MAHIEYGRLDYGVRNGRPQAWEINMAPVLAGNPDRPSRTPAEQESRSLTFPVREFAQTAIRAAFQGIDPGPMQGDDVRVEFPAGFEEQARRERREIEWVNRRRQWISRVAAIPGARAVGPLLRRTFGG